MQAFSGPFKVCFKKKNIIPIVFEKKFACGFPKWHFFRILIQYLKLAIANIENSSYVCMKDSLLLNTKGLIYSGPSSGGALKIRTKCNVFAYCTTICPFLGQKPMIFNNTIF